MINSKLMEVEMSEVEIARSLFKGLEMRTSKYKQEHIVRLLCIQELLRETRKQIKSCEY